MSKFKLWNTKLSDNHERKLLNLFTNLRFADWKCWWCCPWWRWTWHWCERIIISDFCTIWMAVFRAAVINSIFNAFNRDNFHFIRHFLKFFFSTIFFITFQAQLSLVCRQLKLETKLARLLNENHFCQAFVHTSARKAQSALDDSMVLRRTDSWLFELVLFILNARDCQWII